MILSRSSEYAIRLIFYLKERQPLDRLVRIKDIAQDLNVPYNQLAKVANALKSENVLTSLTGPSGGIALVSGVDTLTLLDVIAIFGDERVLEGCILGLSECSEENPCPIHSSWKRARGEIMDIFSNKNLGKLKKEQVLPIITHYGNGDGLATDHQ
ncbi:MAG: Rrf2 family transcriptional regulator [Candidatus Marinimicrobia bacterium]|nr:Rrf2 family transcriptional regulator [Candidatus Neomarinimicrobiota bacterium]